MRVSDGRDRRHDGEREDDHDRRLEEPEDARAGEPGHLLLAAVVGETGHEVAHGVLRVHVGAELREEVERPLARDAPEAEVRRRARVLEKAVDDRAQDPDAERIRSGEPGRDLPVATSLVEDRLEERRESDAESRRERREDDEPEQDPADRPPELGVPADGLAERRTRRVRCDALLTMERRLRLARQPA